MRDTAAFRRHALLPRRDPSDDAELGPQLPAEELLRQIPNTADLLGHGRGVAYLLVCLPDPLARQLEVAGAETAEDEDTHDAEPEEQDDDTDIPVDWAWHPRTGAVYIDDGELQPDTDHHH